MLILTRKIGESINVGDDIVVKVVETGKNSVRIGIEAPRDIPVLRHEVFESIQEENIMSSKGDKNDIAKAARLIENMESKKE